MPVDSNELKASVRLDGGAQFKKDIQDVNSNLKQLDAESKKVTEEFRGQANSVEALRAKQENLTQTLEQAERKVQLYDSRIKSLEKQQKRIADSTEDYRDQLKDAQEALSKMDKGTDAYAKQEKAVDALARKVALGEQNQARATSEINKYRLEQTRAETAVAKLNREVDDNARYLSEAEHSADKCASSIDEYGKQTKQAADESQSLGDVAKVALGNMAADAARKLADMAVDAAKALIEAGKAAAAYADEILTASTVTGLSTDTLQEYRYAAELIDTDLADVEKALAKNVKSMASAQSGSKAYAEAYQKLGVAVTDANGNLRSSEDVFWDCIDALGRIENETEADAIAMQIFGKSAQELNPLIETGSEGFRTLADEAHAAGAVLSSDTLDKLGKVDDSLQRLNSQTDAFKTAAGAAIAPLLGTLADGATSVLRALTDAFTPPPKSELEEYLTNVRDRIDETRESLETVGNVDLTVSTNLGDIESYRSVLEKATTAEKLSGFEKYQVKTAVDKLKGAIPELANAYDAETGAIKLTREEINGLLDDYKRQMQMQAYTDLLTEAYKNQALAAKDLEEANSIWDGLKEKAYAYGLTLEDVLGIADNSGRNLLEDAGYLQAFYTQNADQFRAMGVSYNDFLALATEMQTHYNGTLLQAGENYNAANAAVSDLEQRVDGLISEEEEHTDVTQDYGGAVKGAVKAGADFLKGLFGTKDAVEETAEETDTATESTQANTEATEENTEAKSRAQEVGEKFAEILKTVGDRILEAAEKQKQAEEQEKKSLETVRDAYESNYNSIKDTLNKKLTLWDVFDGGEDVTVEQMVANLQSQTEGITRYKDEMAAVIAEYGDELGPDLVNTLQAMGTDAANTWHHMFITMEQDNAPELFAEMGRQWAAGLDLSDQIAKYCAGNLTAYQIATNQLGSTKVEWTGLRDSVKDMTPELDAAITAAQEAGVAIPDGLAEGLQSGETTAYDAVQLLTNAMQGTFQGLYEIAEQSGVEIPAGLSAGMEGSAEEYQAAIGQLTDALSSAGADAGEAAAEEISTGLTENTDAVESAAGDTADAASGAMDGKKSDFKTAGSTSGTQYASGLNSGKTAATTAGRQLAAAAKSGIDGRRDSFRDAGHNMAAALAAGIRAGQSEAINAAVHMAVEAYKQAKAAIGQRSPTGIFKDELGKNIPLAVAAGITENTAPAQHAAAVMARSTYSAARYAAMVDQMSTPVINNSPVVNVDTAPIARMIGAGQSGAQIVNYITVSGAKDPAAFADAFAEELKQKLRS